MQLKQVSLDDLQHYDMAMPMKGMQPRQVLDEWIGSDLDSRLNVRMELNDINILLNILEKSSYVSILSATTIHDAEDLSAVPLALEHNKMEGCIHSLRGQHKKNSAIAFCRILKESTSVRKYALGLD